MDGFQNAVEEVARDRRQYPTVERMAHRDRLSAGQGRRPCRPAPAHGARTRLERSPGVQRGAHQDVAEGIMRVIPRHEERAAVGALAVARRNGQRTTLNTGTGRLLPFSSIGAIASRRGAKLPSPFRSPLAMPRCCCMC